MFAIEVQATFCASHQLRLPGGVLEPRHGHDWHVTARVVSEQLDALDTVMDFHTLEWLLREVCDLWHHKHLNDLAPFDNAVNPSAERVAQRIAELLAAKIPPPAKLQSISITEAPGCLAVFIPE
jgi:6-pyruvoyltetrahydropterin/6-carboxytetrahydropterin synthase